MRAPCLVLLMMISGAWVAPVSAADEAPAPVQDMDPAAQDAVAVVEAFSAAIKGVRIDEAGALLDPTVLVLESGGSERSREEYLSHHAQADAEYMKDALQELSYRQARAVGDVAWVSSESVLSHDKDGKPASTLSTETMVLRKPAQGWKIVHIHWSSRPAPEGT